MGFRVSLLLTLSLAGTAVADLQPAVAPWEHVHRWLAEQRDQMARDLETAHAALLPRAREAGDAALIEKLRVEPPEPRPHGYGILPEIAAEQPIQSAPARERTYDLEALGSWYINDFRDAAVLASRVTEDRGLPLVPWVDEFRRLRDRLGNLEDHLDYHAKWQVEVVAYRAWFGERNRVIDRVREIRQLEDQGAPAARIAAVRREVLEQLAPFRPTRDLRLERRDHGRRVLVLTVWTDIGDDAFLETTRHAVEAAYSDSPAATERRFAVEVRWRRITPAELYPNGAPAKGSEIDLEDHRGRFPERVLVLTTGATSTHAWTGRSVLLGPSPLSPRTLAHEFGHLLGFDDAYLRGYEGDTGGTYGAVLVEWTGLQDDLMGNPAGGLVTGDMIDTMVEAYSVPPAASPPPAAE